MHKNATFLILFGTLLVAGGFVLREREEMREWQVRQQLLNRQHVSPVDNTASTSDPDPFTSVERTFSTDKFLIDQKTGWKIFKQEEYPLSFLFPPELKDGNLVISRRKIDGKISYSSIVLRGDRYGLFIKMPPPRTGVRGSRRV